MLMSIFKMISIADELEISKAKNEELQTKNVELQTIVDTQLRKLETCETEKPKDSCDLIIQTSKEWMHSTEKCMDNLRKIRTQHNSCKKKYQETRHATANALDTLTDQLEIARDVSTNQDALSFANPGDLTFFESPSLPPDLNNRGIYEFYTTDWVKGYQDPMNLMFNVPKPIFWPVVEIEAHDVLTDSLEKAQVWQQIDDLKAENGQLCRELEECREDLEKCDGKIETLAKSIVEMAKYQRKMEIKARQDKQDCKPKDSPRDTSNEDRSWGLSGII